MHKPTTLLLVCFITLTLSGCVKTGTGELVETEIQQEIPPKETLEGVIISVGSRKMIDIGDKKIEIESRKVTLNEYVGMTVQVTGGYSGTTMFVDAIEVK